ncbi:MAG: hypothetical protein IH936_14170 [Acidobacteria bacterium]|nr:hypothetical protein [Acidobacteriota bacterium]
MRDVKPIWIAVALFAVVAVFFLLTRVSEKVAPVPVALWVAIQPEGEDVARVGPVELPAGTGFRLHAVMEAETFRGGRIYYTEAKRLDLLGEPVSSELLRPWSGRLEARILWFTVEGSTPFRQVPLDEELTAPRFQGIFQPDWGRAWSVIGDVRPTVENFLPGADQVRRTKRFGTQRFQVRIELFRRKKDLTPELRLASWGSEELPGRAAEFPAVTAVLPGVLEAPSRIFGLQQLELESGSQSASTGKQLVSWTDELIAFSRIAVLGKWLTAQGVSWEDLAWEAVELGVSPAAAQPGDLLRVGRRVVWLLEDRGAAGLDDEDWCLDLERGARVERLGDVFVGEGLVDWARAPGLRRGT